MIADILHTMHIGKSRRDITDNGRWAVFAVWVPSTQDVSQYLYCNRCLGWCTKTAAADTSKPQSLHNKGNGSVYEAMTIGRTLSKTYRFRMVSSLSSLRPLVLPRSIRRCSITSAGQSKNSTCMQLINSVNMLVVMQCMRVL